MKSSPAPPRLPVSAIEMKDFERIDRLRREWGDKYVEVDAGVPALRRFAGRVGRVMTINMNGHALVQFTGTKDIGWYDIAPARLSVVAEPALDPPSTAGPAKPKAPPRDVAEAAKENVRRASADEFADDTVDSLTAESAIRTVSPREETEISDDSVDSLAATEAPPQKREPSTAATLAPASQKKVPGAKSEPGTNQPERRNSAPDLGEEET